jgi:hypothetical protein
VILTFFEKVENTKAEMDAKVHSKTCLEKAFSPILSPFMRIKLQNVKKVLNRAQIFFFFKSSWGIKKRRILRRDQIHCESLNKVHPKKFME